MPTFSRVVCIVFVSLFVCAIGGSTLGQSPKRRSYERESLIYINVFHLVVDFDQTSHSLEDPSDQSFIKEYFANRLSLTPLQSQGLIDVSHTYVNSSNNLGYSDRVKLAGSLRARLRKVLGIIAFSRLQSLVSNELVQGMSLPSLDNPDYGGNSTIVLNASTHSLIGTSRTVAYSLTENTVATCDVSATMTGPNVSESASLSNTCSTHPTVTMTSTGYISNSSYCVNGTHTRNGIIKNLSEACLTTPNTPRVKKIEYELIQTDDLALDTNPNEGGGKRLFADRKNSTDTIDRRKIRVKAQYLTATAGVRIYFRNFDVDDPSSDSAPIDTNDTPAPTKVGNDNNGLVDGVAGTRAGKLVVPPTGQPNPYNCQAETNSVSCETDSSGFAKVEFITTRQPGDNFSVVAGPDEGYLSSLVPMDDGLNLKDANNLQVPALGLPTGEKNPCLNSSFSACRSEMLTVWRRLHLEVDSMGLVSGNHVASNFTSPQTIGSGTSSVILNISTLEQNRFENGLINIIGNPFRVIDSDIRATPPVTSNTNNSVNVINPSGPYNILTGDAYSLFDDDDFNDNDGTAKDGDAGDEDVPAPNTTMMASSDTHCSPTVHTNCNAFAVAYIKPYYDLPGSGENIAFSLNAAPTDMPAIFNANFNNLATEASTDFWTVYLLGAYQPGSSEDSDPDESTSTYGRADAVMGIGAFVFIELNRPTEYEDLNHPTVLPPGIDVWTNRPVDNKYTSVHEVGHLLNGTHNDCDGTGTCGTSTNDAGLMAQSHNRIRRIFSNTSISRMRNILHP